MNPTNAQVDDLHKRAIRAARVKLGAMNTKETDAYPGCAWKVWLPDYELEPEAKNWASYDDVDLAAELFALELFGAMSKVDKDSFQRYAFRVCVREKNGTLHQFNVKVGLELCAHVEALNASAHGG